MSATARPAGERGSVTIWLLGLCVALLFLAGLALDLWRALAVRRELAAMADSAAIAGANGLDERALRAGELRIDPARARAQAGVALAGFRGAAGLDAARIDVDADRVEVVVRDHVDFSLLGVFLGGDDFQIEAHAEAVPRERG